MIECPEEYYPYEDECPSCGSDLIDYRMNGPHMAAYCSFCGKLIKFVPKKNLNEWKRLIKERDHYTCRRCGAQLTSKQLHAHHMIPKWFMPELEYDLNNGITLCNKCHHQLHGTDGTIKTKEE